VKDPIRHYATASAFRVALEARLKAMEKQEGTDLQRLRRQVSFDRLLARLFTERPAPWLLKGGYAMELRVRAARNTKDIDLSLPAGAASEIKEHVLKRLQSRAGVDLGDFFMFTVGEPLLDLEAAPEGGYRYPVNATGAERTFAKFHLDVGIGDAVVPPTELLEGRDWLGFAGIAPIKFVAISKEQQFAEKLHAYTLPRLQGINGRVKDVVDMALLLRLGTLDRNGLREAIDATFALRNTHGVPVTLPDPPVSWGTPYRTLAAECGLDWTLSEAIEKLGTFLSEEVSR
jgi:hypothetical protein